MIDINSEGSFAMPALKYDENISTLLIKGRIIPEDPEELFGKLNLWIDEYFNSGKSKLSINLQLYYYNTSSSKRLVFLFKKLDEQFLKGKKIEITWEFEEGDEDTMDDGEDYKNMVSYPFNVVEIPESD